MFTKEFLLDLLERLIFTFVETFVGVLIIDNTSNLSVDTLQTAAIAGVASVLMLLKGLAASQVGNKGTAAALPKPKE